MSGANMTEQAAARGTAAPAVPNAAVPREVR